MRSIYRASIEPLAVCVPILVDDRLGAAKFHGRPAVKVSGDQRPLPMTSFPSFPSYPSSSYPSSRDSPSVVGDKHDLFASNGACLEGTWVAWEFNLKIPNMVRHHNTKQEGLHSLNTLSMFLSSSQNPGHLQDGIRFHFSPITYKKRRPICV